jgi:prevent-host-death family protein
MRSVNIGTLKNQLSSYLRYVQKGEEIVVHDRDKPVARIIPFRAPSVSEEEAYLASIGVLKLPEQEMDWEAFWKLPRPTVSDKAAREAIRWAKGDR